MHSLMEKSLGWSRIWPVTVETIELHETAQSWIPGHNGRYKVDSDEGTHFLFCAVGK